MHDHHIVVSRLPQDEPLVVATRDADAPQPDGGEPPTPVDHVARVSFETIQRRVQPGGAPRLRRVGLDGGQPLIGLGGELELGQALLAR